MVMVYHVTWVILIKSTLFVETAVIKKIHTSKQSKNEEKSQERRKYDSNIRTVAFREI